jgi:hypothetical protein
MLTFLGGPRRLVRFENVSAGISANWRSLAEEEQGFMSTITRQALRTHRPFRSVVMDREGKPVLWVCPPRPSNTRADNSRFEGHSLSSTRGYLYMLTRDLTLGLSVKPSSESTEFSCSRALTSRRWHPWRRRYDLFQRYGTVLCNVLTRPVERQTPFHSLQRSIADSGHGISISRTRKSVSA